MSDHKNINNFKNQFLDIYNPERTIEVALIRAINAAVQRNKPYRTINKKERNTIRNKWKKYNSPRKLDSELSKIKS